MRIATVVMCSLLLAGCSPGAGGEGDGRIRVQVAGEQEEVAVYEALVEAFSQENPDVDVQLVPVADKDDHLQKLTTLFAAGNAPEVFLVNFREYSQFVARGAVEPIEDHLADAELDVADYYPQPLEAFTYDGKLQCFPQNISSLVVYYNRRLFRQAKVPAPDPEWTWEDFRRTAAALTRGDVRGVGVEPSIIRLAPFVWSNGGEIVDDLERPTRFTLDTPEARAALEFVISLARDGLIPTEREVAAQDLETRFIAGKLGMYLSSRRDTPVMREVRGLSWDVAPLPVGRARAGILHSDAYCISRGTDDIDAALDFISFAVGRQGQTITAFGGRTVPSLKTVARSAAFLEPGRAPASSRVFLDGIPYIQRTPVIPTWPEIEDVAEEIFTRAFYEEDYTIDQAIEDLAALSSSLFEEGAPQ